MHLEVVQVSWYIVERSVSGLCDVKHVIPPEGSSRPHLIREHDEASLHSAAISWMLPTKHACSFASESDSLCHKADRLV